MPAVLAGAGTMGIAVLAVIAVGAMLLACSSVSCQADPNGDGGLYAYARHEFGDFAGYFVGWCYWVQSWAGNAAIVASWCSTLMPSSASITPPDGELEHCPRRALDTCHHQPRWRTSDGVVSERHRRPQVRPTLVRRCCWLFFVQNAHFGPFNASAAASIANWTRRRRSHSSPS